MSIKAVIDTNVLVSAFWSGDRETPPFRIYRAIMARRFIPLYSEEIIAEYIDVLHRGRFAFNPEEVDELIGIVRTFDSFGDGPRETIVKRACPCPRRGESAIIAADTERTAR